MPVQARVTAIIPTYKRPLLLKRAVLSVLNQSYPDFVVQILDNASGDGTEDVVRELMRQDPRVRYHRHARNLGQIQNLIFGIERVETEFFCLLSDDDLLMPGFLEHGLAAHERAGGQLAFVSQGVVVVDEHGRFDARHAHPPAKLPPPDGIARCIKAGMSLCGVLYRTSVCHAIGMPRLNWWNWTESGWHALAAIRSPIEILPDVGAILFNHLASGSKKMSVMEFRASWFSMLAEVHEAAAGAGVSAAWWRREILPTAYSRFAGTVVRLCMEESAERYESLRPSAIASGLPAWFVHTALAVARVARALGLGRLLNAGADAIGRSEPAADGRGGVPLGDAAQVFSEMNRRAGLA